MVVVVAVQAQRLPERGVVGVVAGEAGRGLPVRAGAGARGGRGRVRGGSRSDPVGAGVAVDARVWTGPKRRGGEGGEHGRVRGDRVGDAFAADEAGADELVGVALVGAGAGRGRRWRGGCRTPCR